MNECPICDLSCECPSVSINGPTAKINVGDAFIVRANIRGGQDEKNREVVWSVSEGSIVEGQGTSEVLVRTDPKLKANTIKVTFKIVTVCSEACPNIITEEFPVNPKMGTKKD